MPRRLAAIGVSAITLALVGAVRRAEAGPAVSLELLASGFSAPVQVTHAGDGSGRLFVVEQAGRIRVIEGGVVRATPFLDITSLVSSGGERGLLGLAFHPDYETNGFFYVNYTDLSDDTAVARYSVSADPNRADPASGVVLLGIDQPFGNSVSGLFYVQASEIEVHAAVPRNDRVTLTWTAPGDNGTEGRASLYDLRYATALPFVFATAAQASGERLPELPARPRCSPSPASHRRRRTTSPCRPGTRPARRPRSRTWRRSRRLLEREVQW